MAKAHEELRPSAETAGLLLLLSPSLIQSSTPSPRRHLVLDKIEIASRFLAKTGDMALSVRRTAIIISMAALAWLLCVRPIRAGVKSDSDTDRGATFDAEALTAGRHRICEFGANRTYRAFARLFAINDTQFYVYCERLDGARHMCGYFASQGRHMHEYTSECDYAAGEKVYIELTRDATLTGQVYYDSYSDLSEWLWIFFPVVLGVLFVGGALLAEF